MTAAYDSKLLTRELSQLKTAPPPKLAIQFAHLLEKTLLVDENAATAFINALHPAQLLFAFPVLTKPTICTILSVRRDFLAVFFKRICKQTDLECAITCALESGDLATEQIFKKVRAFPQLVRDVDIYESYFQVLQKVGGCSDLVREFCYFVYVVACGSGDLQRIGDCPEEYHRWLLERRGVDRRFGRRAIGSHLVRSVTGILIYESRLDCLVTTKKISPKILDGLKSYGQKYLASHQRLTKFNMAHFRYFVCFVLAQGGVDAISDILNGLLKQWSNSLVLAVTDVDSQMRQTGVIIAAVTQLNGKIDTAQCANWIEYFQKGITAHLAASNACTNLMGKIAAQKLSGIIFKEPIDFELDPDSLEPNLRRVYITLNSTGGAVERPGRRSKEVVGTVSSKSAETPSRDADSKQSAKSRYKVYDMSGDTRVSGNAGVVAPKHVRQALETLNTVSDDAEKIEMTLHALPPLMEKEPHEVKSLAADLLQRIITLENKYDLAGFNPLRLKIITSTITNQPPSLAILTSYLMRQDITFATNLIICQAATMSIKSLANTKIEPIPDAVKIQPIEHQLGKVLKISKSLQNKENRRPASQTHNIWSRFGPEILQRILDSIPKCKQVTRKESTGDTLRCAVINLIGTGTVCLKNQPVSDALKRNLLQFAIQEVESAREAHAAGLREQSVFMLSACLDITPIHVGNAVTQRDLLRIKDLLDGILTSLNSRTTRLLAVNCAKTISDQLRPDNYLE